MKNFAEYLVSITRWTRGQGSRPVEFPGLITEVQSVDKDGKPEFTKPRQKKDGTTPEPEPIMVDVDPDTLPDSGMLYNAIVEALGNVEGKIRLTLAKTYNAIVFAAKVAATTEVPVDYLTPVFAELGIEDPTVQATYRRNVTSTYNIRVDLGKIPANQSAEDAANAKVAILRKLVAD